MPGLRRPALRREGDAVQRAEEVAEHRHRGRHHRPARLVRHLYDGVGEVDAVALHGPAVGVQVEEGEEGEGDRALGGEGGPGVSACPVAADDLEAGVAVGGANADGPEGVGEYPATVACGWVRGGRVTVSS